MSSSFQTALEYACRYCSTTEHCLSEVTEKLRRFELTPTETEALLAYLQQESYVNEGRYATAFSRDKFRFSGWGRVKIRYALRQKGIRDNLIEDALAAIDSTEYQRALNDLLERKHRSLRSENAYERKSKLLRFAASRGFETDLIVRSLHQHRWVDDDE
jgi:regulatory protein